MAFCSNPGPRLRCFWMEITSALMSQASLHRLLFLFADLSCVLCYLLPVSVSSHWVKGFKIDQSVLAVLFGFPDVAANSLQVFFSLFCFVFYIWKQESEPWGSQVAETLTFKKELSNFLNVVTILKSYHLSKRMNIDCDYKLRCKEDKQ